jgi:hypothetical protein
MATYRSKNTVEAFRYGFEDMPKWFIDKIEDNTIVLYGEGESRYCEVKLGEFANFIINYGDYVILDEDNIHTSSKENFFRFFEEVKLAKVSTKQIDLNPKQLLEIELSELNEKIVKLVAFRYSAKFDKLPLRSKLDLDEQLTIMAKYIAILERRLNSWEEV